MDLSKSQRKLFAFDLDGTILLPHTSTVNQKVLDSIHALKECGHCIAVNTGRPFEEQEYVKQLFGIADYWGLYNGNVICDQGRNPIYTNFLTEKDFYTVAEIFFDMGMDIQVCTIKGEFWVYCKDKATIYDTNSKNLFKQIAQVFGAKDISGDDINNIDAKLLWDLQHRIESSTFDCPVKLGHDICTDKEKVLSFFRLQAGLTKGDIIKHIIDAEKIPIHNTYMFGDAGNDIPAFKAVGNPILIKSSECLEQEQYKKYSSKMITQDELPGYLLKQQLN